MSYISSSKKRLITLKNVDTTAINQKYGLLIVSNLEKDIGTTMKTTKIADIISSDIDHMVSFLDETKKNYNTTVTMLEYVNQKTLPAKTDIHCFWCRHPFATSPIGCPVKYVNSSLEKSYVSHITKDKYYMKENVTSSKLANIQQLHENASSSVQIAAIENDYYLTDGIFCSFNCAFAFAKEQLHDLFYKDSISLLHTLYYSFFGKKMEKIVPSPSWRLLEQYGGHLSIAKFRESFNQVVYDYLFTVNRINESNEKPPRMSPIGTVYREKTC